MIGNRGVFSGFRRAKKMSKKKEVERFYLEKFLTILGKTYDHIDERESPDFIIFFQEHRVGVELTEYHSDLKGLNGKSRRQIEEERRFLMENLYNKIGTIPELRGIYVSIMPKGLKLIPKSKHREFANELIQLVREMIQMNCEEIETNDRFPVLSQYAKSLRLKRINSSYCFHWDWGDASFIGLGEDEIIDAVRDKIEKSGTYKEAADELWLLVVSGGRLSQAFPPPYHLEYTLSSFNHLSALLGKSRYSKVYLYQYMFDSIHEYDGCWKWVKKQSGDKKSEIVEG